MRTELWSLHVNVDNAMYEQCTCTFQTLTSVLFVRQATHHLCPDECVRARSRLRGQAREWWCRVYRNFCRLKSLAAPSRSVVQRKSNNWKWRKQMLASSWDLQKGQFSPARLLREKNIRGMMGFALHETDACVVLPMSHRLLYLGLCLTCGRSRQMRQCMRKRSPGQVQLHCRQVANDTGYSMSLS